METPALWIAAATLVPLMAATAWWDLRYLRIPNPLVLGVLAVFLVCGLLGLPLEVVGWRLAAGFVVLLVGFFFFALGAMGGGDAKMAAALVPFISPFDAAEVLLTYAIVTVVLLFGLRLAMHFARHEATGWEAVDQQEAPARRRFFPMGLIFAVTIGIYMGRQVLETL